MEKPAPADFPIHDLLKRRWSPRAFADRPIEPEKLRSLFEAARWAPSSYNEQPWAFLVAAKDRPEAFAQLLGCLVDANRTWAQAAPVLMLTVAHQNFVKNGKPNRHAFHDVGLAIGQLTLQATAEGLVVHQMAGILPDDARTVYGIPADWEAVAGVALGYPGDPASLSDKLREREVAPRERKALAEFVFDGAWGTTSPLIRPAS